MSEQELVADQLLRIIREIQLGRQSGILTVQRGEGATLERGSITFMKGQITQAKADRRTSAEALNWLSTWRNCAYRFTPSSHLESTSGQVATSRPYVPELSGPVTPAPSAAPDTRRGEIQSPVPATSALNRTAKAPFRTRQMNDALQIINYRSLTRTHRHLFLLIDGQRSVAELVQLLNHDEREVYQLLLDLQDAALINIPDNLLHVDRNE